jgi:hypothetical protein
LEDLMVRREERAWEKRREKGEKCFPNLERERDENNEMFLVQIQINILWTRNYQIALASNVLKTTLILFP